MERGRDLRGYVISELCFRFNKVRLCGVGEFVQSEVVFILILIFVGWEITQLVFVVNFRLVQVT